MVLRHNNGTKKHQRGQNDERKIRVKNRHMEHKKCSNILLNYCKINFTK